MVMGFVGAFLFLIPVILIHNLSVAADAVICFLFRRTHRGTSLVDAHGYRPKYAGSASGMIEFRALASRASFRRPVSATCRSNGELGHPLYRLSCASAFWRHMRLAPAA